MALNVQGICDSNKKVQWISSNHLGSCHDSSAFTSTILYKVLQDKKEFLYRNGLFLIGDSAYCMESFLLVPYDSPNMKTGKGQKEDAYNYYHSNSRIQIECTFGEVIMRWGIFWRKLQMKIASVGTIVNCAALVHNFIVDERDEDRTYFSTFSHANLTTEARNDCGVETETAPAGGNNEPRPRGRPVVNDVRSKQMGIALRESLTWMLDGEDLTRPTQQGFKYNQYGMIYME